MKRSTGLNESCLNVCWELAHSLRMLKASQFCLTVSKMLLSMHLAVVSQKNGSNRLWTTPPMKLGRSSDTHEFPSYCNPIGKTWLTLGSTSVKTPNTSEKAFKHCWVFPTQLLGKYKYLDWEMHHALIFGICGYGYRLVKARKKLISTAILNTYLITIPLSVPQFRWWHRFVVHPNIIVKWDPK